jgi:hypothetical protein
MSNLKSAEIFILEYHGRQQRRWVRWNRSVGLPQWWHDSKVRSAVEST